MAQVIPDPHDPAASLRLTLEQLQKMKAWLQRNDMARRAGIVNPADPPPTLPFPIPVTQGRLADQAVTFWYDLLEVVVAINDALVLSAEGAVTKTPMEPPS